MAILVFLESKYFPDPGGAGLNMGLLKLDSSWSHCLLGFSALSIPYVLFFTYLNMMDGRYYIGVGDTDGRQKMEGRIPSLPFTS